jgi:cyanate lyase
MIQKNILKSKLSLRERTQRDLAKALGLSEVSTNKKVNGTIKFSLNEVKKIKEYLNLTNDEVVEIFITNE